MYTPEGCQPCTERAGPTPDTRGHTRSTRWTSVVFLSVDADNNNNNVFNSYRSTPRYIQCNLIYEKKRKIVQKRIQHGEWYNTTANCMLTDILSRMENAPSQPPPQPIHIARLRTTMPGPPKTNRVTRPTMHAKHNR